MPRFRSDDKLFWRFPIFFASDETPPRRAPFPLHNTRLSIYESVFSSSIFR